MDASDWFALGFWCVVAAVGIAVRWACRRMEQMKKGMRGQLTEDRQGERRSGQTGTPPPRNSGRKLPKGGSSTAPPRCKTED